MRSTWRPGPASPRANQSADKRRSGLARPGNATLAECAYGAVRTRGSQFKGWHKAHAGRLGYKRGILAVAHKLLRTILAMLRDNEAYRDPGIDYQALVVHRNAAR